MKHIHYLLLATVITACAKDNANNSQDTAKSDSAAACPSNNTGLKLPAGFCATIFADSLGDARHLVVNTNGDVYVGIQGTEPSPEEKAGGEETMKPPAAVIGLRDTNNDGVADTIVRIGKIGNTGVAIYNGYLYVDQGANLVRYKMNADSLAVAPTSETIISGIPTKGHRARNFVIDQSGALYMNVGSETNSCQKEDRKAGSMGNDPCTELTLRAGIWKYDANKTNQKFSSKERYVTGLRNGMGIAFGPGGQLFATQHGRDQLHDNWTNIFPTTQYQAENPAEELVTINQGDDFGWPYCYYAVDQKKLVTAPEYGGDGKKTDRCTDKKAPLAVFPGHWAPMSLLFYTGSNFPDKYKNGAFIAFHGSWNRAPDPQAGYRVVFQPMNGATANGEFETFADGFAELQPPQLQPGTAKHRPVGLAQGPKGELYITDDVGGRVYRITHQ